MFRCVYREMNNLFCLDLLNWSLKLEKIKANRCVFWWREIEMSSIAYCIDCLNNSCKTGSIMVRSNRLMIVVRGRNLRSFHLIKWLPSA